MGCIINGKSIQIERDYVDNLYDKLDTIDTDKLLRKEIKRLRFINEIKSYIEGIESIDEESKQKLASLINEDFGDEFGTEEQFLNIFKEIEESKKLLSTKDNSSELLSATDRPIIRRKKVKNLFQTFYGDNDKIASQAEMSSRVKFVNAALIDRINGSVCNGTSADFNYRLNSLKNQLFQDLKRYFENKGIKLKSNTFFDKSKNYTGALEELEPYIREEFKDFLNQLKTYNKDKLDAYNNWVFLSNFDTLLDRLFGKAVNIRYFNQEVYNKYEFVNSHPNLSNNLFTYLDANINDLVENVVKLLITTTPLYRNGVKTSEYVSFEQFNSIIGKLKSLVFSKELYNIKLKDLLSVTNGKLHDELYKYINLSIIKELSQILDLYDLTWKTLNINSLLDKDTLIYLSRTIDQTRDKKTREKLAKVYNLINGYNESLADLINYAPRNSLKYWPIILSIFSDLDIRTNSLFKINFNALKLNKRQYDLIYSLSKGVFDYEGDSLYSICDRLRNGHNYYSDITQYVNSIEESGFIQYYWDEHDGVIKTRLLRSGYANKYKSQIEDNILIFNKGSDFNKATEYNFEEITENGKLKFTIPNTSISIEISPSLKDIRIHGNIDWSNENLIKFIEDTLAIDLGFLREDLIDITSGTEYNAKSRQALNDILTFASRITLFKYYNSKYKSEWKTVDDVKKFIETNHFEGVYCDKNGLELHLISNYDVPILNNITQASLIANGDNYKNNVTNAEGNSLSTSVLGRLFENYKSHVKLYDSPDSITRGFSINKIPGLLKGLVQLREFQRFGESKECVLFNPKEGIYQGFVLNFVKGFVNEITSTELVGNGNIVLFPTVVSDKPIEPGLLFNLNEEIDGIKIRDIIEGTNWFESLSNIISREFFEFNKLRINHIINDLKVIVDYYKSTFNSTIDTDKWKLSQFYDYLNENYLKEGFSSPEEYLNEISRIYNISHTQPIPIIKLLHYDVDKNTKALIVNENLEEDYKTFSTQLNVQNWFTKQFNEVFFSLIGSSFDLNIPSKTEDSSLNYIKTHYSDWVDNDKMILGKFYLNGETINISSWIDILLTLEKYFESDIALSPDEINHDTTLKSYKANAKEARLLMDKVLAKGGSFELNPLMGKWTMTDFWLSQSFINSSTGDYVTHDVKVKGNLTTDQKQAARISSQYKRNTDQSATKHLFQLGLLEGVPFYYNEAIIEALFDKQYNIYGDIDDVEWMDGATFVNPIVVYLENYSLGAQAVGMTKKQYVSSYSSRYGAGNNIKTAGFAITNDWVRNSGSRLDFITNDILKKLGDDSWVLSNIKSPLLSKDTINSLINYSQEVLNDKNLNELEKQKLLAAVERVINTLKTYSIKESFRHAMIRLMLNHRWKTENGELFDTDFRFKGLQEYNSESGERIGYQPIYYKDFNDGIDYYVDLEESQFVKNEQGITVFRRIKYKVDEKGNYDPESKSFDDFVVNNNYDLWKVFGAERSESLVNGKLEYSESSILNLVKAVNEIGIAYKPDYKYQEDFYQPLKYANIHYMSSEGSIKHGASGKNTLDRIMSSDLLNFYRVMLYNAGILLDKEHNTEDSEVSLPTQMIQASANLGYTFKAALNIVNALASISRLNLEGLRKSILSKNKSELYKQLTRILENSEKSGELSPLGIMLQRVKDGKLNDIPLSDISVFNKFLASTSAYVTKKGIRFKLPGTLAVLTPSKGLFKIYNGKKYEEYNSILEFLAELDKVDELAQRVPKKGQFDTRIFIGGLNGLTVVDNLSNVELGRTYKIVKANGLVENYEVFTPLDYINFCKYIRNNSNSIQFVSENILVGRDLANYNVRFDGKNLLSDEIKSYQLFDLDSVLTLFKLENEFETFNLDELNLLFANYGLGDYYDLVAQLQLDRSNLELKNTLIKITREIMKNDMLSLSPNVKSDNILVVINGLRIEVDKSTIRILNPEVSMPKTLKEAFNLSKFDSVDKIKHDKDFFLKKLINSLKVGIDINLFDICLLKLDGNHLYLVNKKNVGKLLNFTKIDNPDTYVDEGGDTFLLDSKGNKIRQIKEGTEIYQDNFGNYIYVTDDFLFYIDNENYFNVIAPKLNKDQLIDLFNASENPSATDFIETNILGEEALLSIDKIDDYRLRNKEDSSEIKLFNKLDRLGRLMYASWLMSLKVISGRTPGQSLQSYMGMDVIAYENEDLNNVQVSTMLIWLQGSDFDIDVTTIINYDIKDGIIELHSPYAKRNSINQIEQSLKYLPFPTGKEIKVEITSDMSSEEYKKSAEFLEYAENLVETVEGRKGYFFKEGITLLQKGEFLERANEFNSFTTTESNVEKFLKLVNLINKHNLYLKKKNSSLKEQILNNYLIYNLHTVMSEAINLIQELNPLDKATKHLKDIANNSDKNDAIKYRSLGNVVNKYESLFDTQVGKQGVGINAVGLKVFSTNTQATNYILNFGTKEQMRRILGGTTDEELAKYFGLNENAFKLIANARTINKERLIEYFPEVYEILINNGYSGDAAVETGVLVSLAVDNAKELALFKLNANTKTLGMYIYGVNRGMTFDMITSIIMSPIGNICIDLLNSDVFNESGLNFDRMRQVFTFLEKGVSTEELYKMFGYEALNTLANKLQSVNSNVDVTVPRLKILSVLLSKSKNPEVAEASEGEPTVNKDNTLTQLAKIFDMQGDSRKNDPWRRAYGVYKKLALKEEEKLSGLYTNLIKFIALYSYYSKVKSNYGKTYDAFKALYEGADVLKKEGLKLSLNQGIDTKLDELILKIDNFRNTVKDFNLFEYAFDPEAEEYFLDEYDKLDENGVPKRVSINELQMISAVPNFKAYVEALAIVQSLANLSILFRSLDKIKVELNNRKYGLDSSVVSKGLRNFINDYLINTWLVQLQYLQFKLPEDITYNGVTYKKGTEIKLGESDLHNQLFKQLVEQIIYRDIKKDEYLKNTRFVKSLIQGYYTDTKDRNEIEVIRCRENMMPMNSFESDKFHNVKDSFDREIKDRMYNISERRISLGEIFYLYNMITFSKKINTVSFTKLFDGSNQLLMATNYLNFIAELDKSEKIIELDKDFTLDEVLPYIVSGNKSFDPKYFRQRNKQRKYEVKSSTGLTMLTPDVLHIKSSGNDEIKIYDLLVELNEKNNKVKTVNFDKILYKGKLFTKKDLVKESKKLPFVKISNGLNGRIYTIDTNELYGLLDTILEKEDKFLSLLNSSEYKTLLKRSRLPELYVKATSFRFFESYGRLPRHDELPNSDSTESLKEALKIKDRTVKIKDLLDFTGKSDITQAVQEINKLFSDLEVSILPLVSEAIIDIKKRPTEYNFTPEEQESKFNEDVNMPILLHQSLSKLALLYGIDIKPVEQSDLESDELRGLNASLAKGFIFNGNIYLNVNNVSKDTLLHEMLHLFLGSMRYTNPDLYLSLVNSSEKFLAYDYLSSKFKNRTRLDINEELFIQEFAKYMTGQDSQIGDLSEETLYEINYNMYRVLDSILMGQDSTKTIDMSELALMSLEDIVKMVNSSIMNENVYFSKNDASLHRSIANAKQLLMEEGKLKEYC